MLAIAMLAGCTAADPEPEPELRYEPVVSGYCEQLRFEEVAARFDLTWPQEEGISSQYSDFEALGVWTARCWLRAVAIDERFAAEDRTFMTRGFLELRVDREPDRVRAKFEERVAALEQWTPLPSLNLPGIAERERRIGPVEGWWDDGVFAEWVEPHEDETRMGARIEYHLSHRNLYVEESWLTAVFPPEDREEAVEFLHELLLALIDEAVGQMSLTTDPWPSITWS